MKNKICITDDLADVFMIQALKEGYCDYLIQKSQKQRNDFADYMLQDRKYTNAMYQEKFDRLSQLILMYDKIEFPILNQGFNLHGDINEFATIRHDLPMWLYSNLQINRDILSDEDAMVIKPIIMSAIKNIHFSSYYLEYARKRAGTPIQLFDKVYDMMYNHKKGVHDAELFMDTSIGYSKIYDGIELEPNSPEACSIYTEKTIITLVKSVISYLILNQTESFDYYSRVFENLSTETKVNEAYCIVKTQISYIMERQPVFNNLSEVIRFKQKNRNALKTLRNEINSLEELLRNDFTEIALQKAIADVRAANEVLIKGSKAKKIAQIATYISVPISLFELLTFRTSFSMAISIVGTFAQIKSDMKCKESDWLFVAR